MFYMSFISFAFAYFFLFFSCVYYFLPKLKKHALIAQKISLFCASLFFYAFADVRFLPFLLYVVAVSYIAGLLCRKSKGLFFFFIAIDLAPLLFFKYACTNWIFPLGISFFTFQSLSYIADVRTRKIEENHDFLDVALFVTFFPVISSGPIQRAGGMFQKLNELHRFDYYAATEGMKLFAWGMFKKLLIADRIALYVNYVYADVAGSHGLALAFATLLYSVQIYCDFSGYSDMAIGVSKYLGFNLDRNFDHPYFAKSVGEFWRRWHISLSSWLRDYVYIPLGGSRVALPRIYLNLIVTFLVSGIWHGSTMVFIVWGLLHGLYQCVGRGSKKFWEKLNLPSAVHIVITFLLISFAWIFFRAQNLTEALLIVKKVFMAPVEIPQFLDLIKSEGVKNAFHVMFSMVAEAGGATKGMTKIFIFIAVLLVSDIITFKQDGLQFVSKQNKIVRWIGYFLICSFVLYSINTSTNTNFLYFAF